ETVARRVEDRTRLLDPLDVSLEHALGRNLLQAQVLWRAIAREAFHVARNRVGGVPIDVQPSQPPGQSRRGLRERSYPPLVVLAPQLVDGTSHGVDLLAWHRFDGENFFRGLQDRIDERRQRE